MPPPSLPKRKSSERVDDRAAILVKIASSPDNDAPNDLYPETYTFGEGTPDWMYRVPPFRMLDPGDHMMDRYIKHAKTWAEAAKAGAADVE